MSYEYIRMKELFRGSSIKALVGIEFNQIKYYKVNKVLVTLYTKYYYKFQRSYNKSSQNTEEER